MHGTHTDRVNPFNLSLCAATRADSCKERKDTPGIAFSGGASPGNEITGLPLKLARPANNRAYYVAFVSTALLSPCAEKARRLALHTFSFRPSRKGLARRGVPRGPAVFRQATMWRSCTTKNRPDRHLSRRMTPHCEAALQQRGGGRPRMLRKLKRTHVL